MKLSVCHNTRAVVREHENSEKEFELLQAVISKARSQKIVRVSRLMNNPTGS